MPYYLVASASAAHAAQGLVVLQGGDVIVAEKVNHRLIRLRWGSSEVNKTANASSVIVCTHNVVHSMNATRSALSMRSLKACTFSHATTVSVNVHITDHLMNVAWPEVTTRLLTCSHISLSAGRSAGGAFRLSRRPGGLPR